MKRAGTILTLLWLCLMNSQELSADTITGKVVAVTDGDTIKVLTSEKVEIRVRLEGIDAPENRQDFSAASKQYLSELIFGENVKVEVTGRDRYGRTLGNVFAGDTWANLEMVKVGLAWHYTKYNSDKRLSEAEMGAKKKRVGLWAGEKVLPPWEWRKLSKEERLRLRE